MSRSVEWEEAFGWLKKKTKINKYVGSEAFLYVIKSILNRGKKECDFTY